MPALLQLNSYHYRRGGADVVYFEHEAIFSALGWKTAHLAMQHPRNEPSPWSEYFVDEIEFGHNYGTLAKIGMAAKVVYSLEARRKLSRLLERFRPSIAHVHCIYHHLSPSVLPLLRERGVPVVLTAHDLKIACPAYKMLSRTRICERCKGGNLLHVVAGRCVRDSLAASTIVAVESFVSRQLGLYRRNLSRVVAPSRFYMQKLQEWGWPAEMLTHIPNYVDATRYSPQFEPGDYFVYFGRLAPEKGLLTLIRAAAEARVRLVIAGTGPLEAKARELASTGQVQFVGHVSGDALWSLVRGSRAAVLPSEWYENAPMSILEAYALGKPVLGARIGGIPELVIEGESGVTFESGSVSSLAGALANMAAMSATRLRAMGTRARQLCEQQFTLERYRSRMLDLYVGLKGEA